MSKSVALAYQQHDLLPHVRSYYMVCRWHLQALTYDSSTGRLLVVVEAVKTTKGYMPFVHVSAASLHHTVV
jgi:hypothetical protein